jgi:hypothetical protein
MPSVDSKNGPVVDVGKPASEVAPLMHEAPRVYFDRVRALPVYTPARRELRALEKGRAEMRQGNYYTLDEFSEWLLGRPGKKPRGKKAPARAKA